MTDYGKRIDKANHMDEYSIADILLQSYISIDFPAQYVATMKTPQVGNVGISDFYTAFCAKNNLPIENNRNVLFQPALVLGYLYTTFILPQQSFYTKIPITEINMCEWGFAQIDRDTNLSLQHIARRIRNALSHNRIFISKNMDFTFWDAHPKVTDFSNAEAIYRFEFDGLMFRFIPKWYGVLEHVLTEISH